MKRGNIYIIIIIIPLFEILRGDKIGLNLRWNLFDKKESPV